MFIGRKEVLGILNKRVLSFSEGYRQNIAIFGDEFVGKSSLIKYYLNNHLPPTILPIYSCLEHFESAQFPRHLCGILLYNFLRIKEIKPNENENLDNLIIETEKYLPQTILKIKSILSNLDKQKINTTFESLFDLLGIFAMETRYSCLVILDEFQAFESLSSNTIYKELGKRIMLQKNIMYILTSSLPIKAKKILENDLLLLFGNFEIVTLEPFDMQNASELIAQKLPKINMNAIYNEFIVNLCGGYPYYITSIYEELHFICKVRDKTTASFKDILEVLEQILFNPSGKLNIQFNSKLQKITHSKIGKNALNILFSIASGINKLCTISNHLNKTKKDILQHLSRFIETNQISQNGSFYKINDKFFSLWLILVSKIKRESFDQNIENLRRKFQDEIQRMFDIFSQESRKKTIDRIIELFNLFKDESVNLETKHLKLADFKDIQFFGFDNTNMRMLIIAKDRQDTLWIAFIKDGAVTEEDVIDFSQHLKNTEVKAKRKIIIGLSHIDPNARLKALKEKMLIWNRKNVNQLFELYGKPLL